MSAWLVAGPHGARRARNWTLALDLLCQDVKTSLLKARPGLTEAAAEVETWALCRRAEWGEPYSVTVAGARHVLERAECESAWKFDPPYGVIGVQY